MFYQKPNKIKISKSVKKEKEADGQGDKTIRKSHFEIDAQERSKHLASYIASLYR